MFTTADRTAGPVFGSLTGTSVFGPVATFIPVQHAF